MPRALLGHGSCRRCGSVRSQGGNCSECGALWASASGSTAIADAGLTGVVRASLGRRYLADLVDLVPPLVIAAIAVAVLLTTSDRAFGWLLLGIAAAVALIESAWVLATGRSLGRLLVGLRTVDDLTGTPIGFARLRRRLAGAVRSRSLTADLRNGRDPIRPHIDPATLAGALPETDGEAGFGVHPRRAAYQPRFLTAASVVWIVLEDGARRMLTRPLVIGRDPDLGSRDGYDLLALPDLSRRLDKTHLALERTESSVWVTDLDSATGTAVVGADGVRTPLAAEVRSPVPIGATIECGGRRLTVVADG